jgi:DNA-directed RNA polymerase specialized sigma24 family protein
VIELSDEALHALLTEDPERGWHAFVDRYTPALMTLLERAGVVDRDERLEVYVRICEKLADGACARLRQHDPAKGSLVAWLAVVVRHAVVDWVRSRAGRPRLFGSIETLDDFARRVFELYYWERHSVAEIVELAGQSEGRVVSMMEVFDALARIEQAMSDRQRSHLLAATIRHTAPVPLEMDLSGSAREPADARPNPEAAFHATEIDRALTAALASLPDEDGAIVRMMFVHGWPIDEVQRALHLHTLSRERVRGILQGLRATLEGRGIHANEATTRGLTFLEESPHDPHQP